MFRTDLLKIQALISGIRNLHILCFHILKITLYCSKITDLIFAVPYSDSRFVNLLIFIAFICCQFIFLCSICLHISVLVHLQLVFCSICILIFRILTAFCIICRFFQLCILCSICCFCLLCICFLFRCFRLFISCSYL